MGSENVVTNVLAGVKEEDWFCQPLSIFIFGASGDLAKKKTFPALLDLFVGGLLPKDTRIVGYARSDKSIEDFKKFLTPFLESRIEETGSGNEMIEQFLSLCSYRFGGYGDAKRLKELSDEDFHNQQKFGQKQNRLYYMALPPQVFLKTAQTVKESMILPEENRGFVRLVVEKPFGNDTESAIALREDLSKSFCEEELYRIDHYLGKELVQNILFLRFANCVTESIWSRNHVKCVIVSFKENFGTEGRGGYFEKSGIIRDIMQNHLLQVLSLIAMESPIRLRGEGSADLIRDEKVKVLKCIRPWKVSDCVLGQYEGYRDDPTVDDQSKRETFCCAVTYVNNRRWAGVPFILKAGKALDSRKAEVRIQLRNPPGYFEMFDEALKLPRQEIVIRFQPAEAIYIKTNVKKPGLAMDIVQSELNLSYKERHQSAKVPDAYTRLILDVLRGRQSMFVRDDEVISAWKIVSPLLKELEGENKDKFNLIEYKQGSRGPPQADELIRRFGLQHSPTYGENWNAKV